MLNFVFKRLIFRVQESAFLGLNELKIKRADVAYLHSNDTERKNIPKGGIIQQQYTLVTDLSHSEEELLSYIKKNCRYEIRRSEREGALATVKSGKDISDSAISRFENTYNKMFKNKGMSGYSFNRELVLAARNAGFLVISYCTNSKGENEVFHAYLCDGRNCILMYSASPLWSDKEKDRAKQIGMMNKYLHWKDILYFKKEGYSVYEWGGITNPDKPNGIDKFKMEYGGKVVRYNNYVVPKTILGYVYSYLVRRKSHE